MKVKTYSLLQDRGIPYLAEDVTLNANAVADRPDAVVEMLCGPLFQIEKQAEEHAYIIALDNKKRCTAVFLLSKGTVGTSIVNPREIFVRLCLAGACGFILAHNHPSGDTTPSPEDVQCAKRLKEAGELMGIPFFDSIIIGGENEWLSMYAEGVM